MSKKIKSIYFASATFPDEEKQRSKLRSPPPLPPQHQEDEEEEEEEEEREDVEIENECVEIADIAEQKKLAMEKDDEKSKSHLLHSASFYGYSGQMCPQTPSKKLPDGKWREEEDIQGWERDEEMQLEGHGRLMERSDTKFCLIVSSDYRLTPRKIAPSPVSANSFLVEEEDEEERVEEELKLEINEVLEEDGEYDKEEEEEEVKEEALEMEKDIMMENTDDRDSIKIINVVEEHEEEQEEEEAQRVVDKDTENSEPTLSDSSSGTSGGEEEPEEKKASTTGPKKSQTEHRLVVKKDKSGRGSLVMNIPLETIRSRRKQKAQKDCIEDILNYV